MKEPDAWFFACWYIFMEIKSWFKDLGAGGRRVDVVKNGCGHSVHGTLKLAISQEEINRVNWFVGLLIRIQVKAESYFNKFWMVVFKRGCGPLGLVGSLKSSVSQEWMKWTDFLHTDTNLGKLKVTIGWIWSKMGKVL